MHTILYILNEIFETKTYGRKCLWKSISIFKYNIQKYFDFLLNKKKIELLIIKKHAIFFKF